jgi:hypothetical protein
MRLIFVTIFITLFCSSVFGLDRRAIESRLHVGAAFKTSGQTIDMRINELNRIQSELDAQLEQGEDPELLFLKGIVIRQYAYTIQDPLTGDDLESLRSIDEESNRWLQRSIESGADELSVDQLYIISRSSSHLAVKVIDEIMNRDERLKGNDRLVIEMKSMKIDALMNIGEYELALSEAADLRSEFPDVIDEGFLEVYQQEVDRLKVIEQKSSDTQDLPAASDEAK